MQFVDAQLQRSRTYLLPPRPRGTGEKSARGAISIEVSDALRAQPACKCRSTGRGRHRDPVHARWSFGTHRRLDLFESRRLVRALERGGKTGTYVRLWDRRNDTGARLARACTSCAGRDVRARKADPQAGASSELSARSAR